MSKTYADALRTAALRCGAYKAELISADRIVTDRQFRCICEGNACGRYGRCYQCPPDIGEIDRLMNDIRSYSRGLLYQSVAAIEDSFDFEGMMEGAKAHLGLSHDIQKAAESLLPVEFLHLSSGCRLCEVCAKVSGLPCRHPDKALGAMEGYGIDVYQTVKSTELKYANGTNTVTYFGIVLFKE